MISNRGRGGKKRNNSWEYYRDGAQETPFKLDSCHLQSVFLWSKLGTCYGHKLGEANIEKFLTGGRGSCTKNSHRTRG